MPSIPGLCACALSATATAPGASMWLGPVRPLVHRLGGSGRESRANATARDSRLFRRKARDDLQRSKSNRPDGGRGMATPTRSADSGSAEVAQVNEARQWLAGVVAGGPFKFPDDLLPPSRQEALKSAVQGGLDPDDPSLPFSDETREWMREQSGRPTRWETNPEARPGWLRAQADHRRRFARRHATTAIRARSRATVTLAPRCRQSGSRERRRRPAVRRSGRPTRAGPDGSSDPPPPPVDERSSVCRRLAIPEGRA